MSIIKKCNDLIRLAAEISTLSLQNTKPTSINESLINSVKSSNTQIGVEEDTNNKSKINISIENAENTKSVYYKRIPIEFKDNYDCGDLFIKIMGDEDNRGKYKWLSVIENVDNYFNLRGEIKFPLNVVDVRFNRGVFIFMVDFNDIKWAEHDPPSILEESEEPCDLSDDLDIEDMINLKKGVKMEGSSSDSDYREEGEGDEVHTSEDEYDSDNENSGDDNDDDDDNDDEVYELDSLILKKDGIHVSIA